MIRSKLAECERRRAWSEHQGKQGLLIEALARCASHSVILRCDSFREHCRYSIEHRIFDFRRMNIRGARKCIITRFGHVRSSLTMHLGLQRALS